MLSSAHVSAIIVAILSLMSPNSPMGRPNARRSLHRSTAILMTRLHSADAAAREAEAPAVEHLHRDLEAASRLAEHVGGRDAHVVEEQLGRRAAADAQLVLRWAAPDPPSALDDERRDPRLGVLVGPRGPREDREDVGEAAVGDPDLLPAEHVAPVALDIGARLDGRGVAAGARLGQRERRDALPAREARQVPALLLVGAEEHQPLRADRLVRAQGHRHARVEPRHLLHCPGVARVREPHAPVALRDSQPEEARAPGDPRRTSAGICCWRSISAESTRSSKNRRTLSSSAWSRSTSAALCLGPREDEALVDGPEEQALHQRLLAHADLAPSHVFRRRGAILRCRMVSRC